MKFKAVIFDMDGVLVDTERYYLQRREEFFGGHGISISHLTPSDFIGGNMKDIWPRILQGAFDEDKASELQEDYEQFKENHPMPYAELLFSDVPDILEFLRQKEVKIAQTLFTNRVDGIIISIAMETVQFDHLKQFSAKNIPLIFFDRVVDEIETHKIVVDRYKRRHIRFYFKI